MRVYKKSGTKERLFEMFENVNKIKLNEAIDRNYDENTISTARTSGQESYESREFNRLTSNNFQAFKDESNISDEEFNKYSKDELEKMISDYVSIRESFDSPKEKDKKYLDKTVGDDGSQVSKYDDGTRYPVEDKLKVKDPSLEKLKGDDAPIEECEDCDDEYPVDEEGQAPEMDMDGEEEESFEDGEDGEEVENEYPVDNDTSDDIAMDIGYEDSMEGGLADDAMPSDFEEEMKMSPDMEDDESPEDALLDPSKHWIDDYSPQNVTDETVNYPTPSADSKAVEDEYEARNKSLAPNWVEIDRSSQSQFKNNTPQGYKVALKDVNPADDKFWFQSLPSHDTADAAEEMSSPVKIQNWKNKFISKFGNEGILEKGTTLNWKFDIIGNEKYNQWKNERISRKAGNSRINNIGDSYEPAMNEESSHEIYQEIYDELEMRYSHTTKNIPFDEINDVAEMYGVELEDIAQIAAQVIADNVKTAYDEITDDVKELIKRLQDQNVQIHTVSPRAAWEVFEKEYEASSDFNEFKEIWDKLTKDPNQLNMFGESNIPQSTSIKYNYDKNGNWIPIGYEDKKVALRSIEQPVGSGNWKVGVVILNDMGEFDDFIKIVDTWDEAKSILHSSIT